MEVTVVVAQRTMRQSQIDLANTHEYRRARVLGRLTAVEGPGSDISPGESQARITPG